MGTVGRVCQGPPVLGLALWGGGWGGAGVGREAAGSGRSAGSSEGRGALLKWVPFRVVYVGLGLPPHFPQVQVGWSQS